MSKLNPKLAAGSLAGIVGVSPDSPTNTAVSWATQTSPEVSMQQPNPLNPLSGDETFYTYLMPGAVFQAHDGSQWEIEAYNMTGTVEITNRWIPRTHGIVPVADIRRSIHSWIEPVLLRIPPPIEGIVY